MQFNAKARYVRFSPYKLRPLADVVRGKNVSFALHWLATHAVKRIVPVQKVIESLTHRDLLYTFMVMGSV